MALDRVVATQTFAGTTTPAALSINTTGRDLLIVVVITDAANTTITGINHNGDALTLKERYEPFSASINAYFRIAPDQGTLNVNVTLSQDDTGVIYAIAYSGADQTTPLGTEQSADSESPHTSVTTTLAAATGDECLAWYNFNGTATLGSFASGETQIGTTIESGVYSVLSRKDGAASTVMSLAWTPSATYNGNTWSVPVKAAAGAAAEAEQEGFRWRDDDGSESAATWLDAQDTSVTRAIASALRLRVLINGTGDLASAQYRLDYKLSTDSVYVAVPVFVAPSVTYGDAGTASAGTTSVTPAYPTGISASTSKLFCMVTGRSSTADTAPTMAAGWTSVLDFEGGTGTYGTDTGTRRVTVFQKDVTTGSETGTETVSLAGSGTNTLRAIIFRFEVPSGHGISVQASTGADTSDDTSYSATGGTALDLTANDLLMTVTAQNLDTGTQTSQTITATGVTLGTRTNRATAPVTAGADHRQIIETIPVSSGSATVAPSYTYTVSAAASGPTGFLRMRSLPSPIHLALSSNIAASGENTTVQLAAPSGKTTSDFVAGRIQDDENPADAVDITADDYTELEWCLVASAAATNGQVYQFRVTVGGTPLDTYTVTPQWTIGSSGATAPKTMLLMGAG